MAERSRTVQDTQSAVAVDEPTLSATERYTMAVEGLQAEEARLAALRGLQASGQRLSREHVLDVYELEEAIGQLRAETESLRQPMLDEVRALDIADVVDISNNLGFEEHLAENVRLGGNERLS